MTQRRTGVIGEFDVSAFSHGLDIYIAGLIKAETTTVAVVGRINAAISAIRPFPVPQAVAPTSNTLNQAASQINQIQSNVSSQVVNDLITAMSGLNSTAVEGGLTNLNDLVTSLRHLDGFKGSTTAITTFINQLTAAVAKLGNANLSTLSSTLSTLSFALESLGGLGKINSGVLIELLDTLTHLKVPPVNQFAGIEAMAAALAKLGAVGDLSTTAKSIKSFAVSAAQLSTLKPIPSGTAASIQSLLDLLARFTNVAELSHVAGVVTKISAALKTFNKFPSIQQSTLSSLEDLGKTMQRVGASFQGGIVQDFSKIVNSIKSLIKIPQMLALMPTVPLKGFENLSVLIAIINRLPPVQNVEPAIKAIQSLMRVLGNIKAFPTLPANFASTIFNLAAALRTLSGVDNTNVAAASIGTMLKAISKMGSAQPIPPAVVASVKSLLAAITQIAGGAAAAQLQALGNVLASLAPNLRNFSSAASTASTSALNFGNSVKLGMGVEVGRIAIQTILGIKNALEQLFAGAYASTQFFENFRLSLQTVVSSQLRTADSTLTVADSLEKAKDAAFAYEQIIIDMAVESKFTSKELAKVFQTGITRSLDTDQALRVLKALVDFGAGSGGTADQMNSIALAIGQINASSKLRGQDINQLADAGVPVFKILQEGFSKTKEEIQKMLEDGVIPSSDALELITRYLETNFAGAAARTQQTLTGVTSSLIDLQELSTAILFENVFKPVLPVLKELVDFLNNSEFRAGLVVLGEIIGTQLASAVEFLRTTIGNLIASFNALSPETKQMIAIFVLAAIAAGTVIAAFAAMSLIIGLLFNPFTVLVGAVALLVTVWTVGFDKVQSVTISALRSVIESFGIVSDEAVEWGVGMMNALADGIQSAVGAIIDALNYVASAIAYLLAPGSPPRLLPDLEIWGTKAAEVFLAGWTKANFDALHEFGALVEQQIQNLFESGAITEVEAIQFKIDVKQQLAEAIEQIRQFGEASQETISEIARIAGISVEIVQQYVEKYAAVVAATLLVAEAQAVFNAATQGVTDAQNALNAEMERYDALLKPLKNKLAALNKIKQDADDEEKIIRLQRVIDSAATSQAQKTKAQAQIDEIRLEAQIAGVEAERDAAEEAGEEKISAAEKIAQAAQAQLDLATAVLTKEQEKLDLFLLQIAEQQVTVDLAGQMKTALEAIAKSLAEVAKSFGDVGDKIKKALDPLEKQLKGIQLQQAELAGLIELKKQQAILDDAGATAAEKAAAALKIQELQIQANIRAAEAKELGIDLTAIGKIPIVFEDITKKSGTAKEGVAAFGDKFEGLKDIDLTGKLKEFEKTVDDIGLRFDKLGKSFDDTITKIDAQMPTWFKLKGVGGETATAIDAVVFAFGALGLLLSGKAVLSSIPLVSGVFRGLWWVVARLVVPAIGALAAFLAPAAPLLLAIAGVVIVIALLREAWRVDFLGIKTHTLAMLKGIRERLDAFSKYLSEKVWFQNMGKNLVKGLQDAGFATVEPAKQVGVGIGDGIVDGVAASKIAEPTLASNVVSVFAGFVARMALYWGIHSPSDMTRDLIGKPIGDGIVQGVAESKLGETTLATLITDAFKTLIDGIKKYFGITSPSTLMQTSVGEPLGDGVVQGLIDALIAAPGKIILEVQTMIDGVFSLETLAYAKTAASGLGISILDGIKEAFSDPVGSVKGAFTGLIDSLFGAGAEEAEAQSPSKRSEREIGTPIAEGITEGLSNGLSLSTITGLVATLIASFVGLTTSVLLSIGTLVLGAVTAFGGLSTSLQTTVTTMTTNIVQMFTDQTVLVLAQVLLLKETAVQLFTDTYTLSAAQVTLLKTDVVQLFTDTNTLSVAQVTLQASATVTAFTTLNTDLTAEAGIVPLLKANVVKIFENMRDAVVGVVDSLTEKIKTAFEGIIEALKTYSSDLGKTVGGKFGDGFVDGLLSKIKSIQEAAKTVINAATKAAKEAAGISSPSKLAQDEIGTPFTQGISEGILGSVGELQRAVTGIMGSAFNVADRVNSRLSGANSVSNVTNSRTSVYNLSVNSQQSTKSIARSFAVMEAFSGS